MTTTFSKLLQEPTSKTKSNLALEDLINRGIFDERDIDYLNHLHVPDAFDATATEGIIKAMGGDIATASKNVHTEIKGWFLDVESKRKYIEQICNDLIDWLKDQDATHDKLSLDMGKFKTWMKTSQTAWRFYFLLNDNVWNKIQADLKAEQFTALENGFDINFNDRSISLKELESASSIKDLIKIVEKYIKRSNTFFEIITKRKVKFKSVPFQIILLGATDLRITTKKIVNLAI